MLFLNFVPFFIFCQECLIGLADFPDYGGLEFSGFKKLFSELERTEKASDAHL
jgi:hypothetical protein